MNIRLVHIFSSNFQESTFSEQLSKLSDFFGDVHHIKLKESDLEEEIDWVTECLARLFIHSRLYQCSR